METLLNKIESYGFECEAGPLKNCTDWTQLREVLRINGLTAEAAEQREQGQAVEISRIVGLLRARSVGDKIGKSVLGQEPERSCLDEAADMLERFLATPPAGVPDEATPAMLEAYGRVLAMGSELDGAMVWRAMLSAAPQPAAQDIPVIFKNQAI